METPHNFLGLPEPYSHRDQAGVWVLPIPYEATVSYGQGTTNGPEAIILASQQVELYDREFGSETALEYGVHTLEPVSLAPEPAASIEAITLAAARAMQSGKLVVGLGGEHSASLGFGRGLIQTLGGPITILQIDAHSDLRDHYDGTPFSHACVIRRLLEHAEIEQVLQLGIRSTCPEEVEFARENPARVKIWYAEDVHSGRWKNEFLDRITGKRVYLTLDVDGLDPAVIPATGTPEPDGLTWTEALDILRLASQNSTILAMDCVELAPNPHLHHADFAAAKLVYKAINYIQRWSRSSNNPAALEQFSTD